MRYLILCLALTACGPGAAQTALSAQASVVVATRPARVDFYESMHAGCVERPSMPEYEACMAPARHVARASDAYRETLLGAQAALSAGADEGALLPCVIVAARHLAEALDAANVPIPAEVSAVARLIPEGLCRN